MLLLKNTILTSLLLIILIVSPGYARQIKIIANPDVKIDSLSSSDLKDIFLGKNAHWKNGEKITLFILKSDEKHEAFLDTYIGKSSSQFRRVWRTKVFAGRAIAPKPLSSEQEMIQHVAVTPGAIGYVTDQADLRSVKSLSVR